MCLAACAVLIGVVVVAGFPSARAATPAESLPMYEPSVGVIDDAGGLGVWWLGGTGLWRSYDSAAGQVTQTEYPATVANLDSGPAAIDIYGGGGQAYFWRGPDGGLWDLLETASGTIGGPAELWTPPSASSPSVMSTAPNVISDANGLTAVWRGVDGGLWRWSQSAAGGVALTEMPGTAGRLASAPTVVDEYDGSGAQAYFWCGVNAALWGMEPGSPATQLWAPPSPTAASAITSAPTAISDGAGTSAWWRGADGGLWRWTLTSAGGTPAAPVYQGTTVEYAGTAGTLGGAPVAVDAYTGGGRVFIWLSPKGNISELLQNAAGVLSGPQPFPSPTPVAATTTTTTTTTATTPTATTPTLAPAKPVKSKTPPVLARVRVQIRLHWAWDGPETQLTRIGIGRLPAGASLAVGCRGHGCPRPARRLAAGSRQIGALLRALHGLRYRAGDRLTIVLAVPRMISERAEILIRDGKLPRVRAV
jgi:hypothetical protein